MFSTFLLFISVFGSIFWTLIFIPLYLLGYKLFVIRNNAKIALSVKKTKFASSYDETGKPNNFIITPNGFGFLRIVSMERSTTQTLYFISKNKKFISKLTNSLVKNSHKKWYPSGNYFNLRFNSKNINLSNYDDRTSDIVDDIVLNFKNNDKTSVFIYGKPGLGKTSIGYCVAKKFKNSNVISRFNPSEPNHSMDNLYDTINPTKNKPLIIIMDEIDILIENIHEQKIEKHKYIPISVYDKRTFNSWLDDISNKHYENIILVMTSNKTKDCIDKLDSSYLREGRVNKYFELK